MIKPLFAALQFLTIFPIPFKTDEKSLAGSSAFFSLAGVVVGAFSALFYLAAEQLQMGAFFASAFAVFGLALASGGLHLDGLADSADGILSHRPREKALEIMKDSRIGTMGTLALVFVILIKCAALSSLTPKLAVTAIILAPCVSRNAMAVSLAIFPCARKSGLANLFSNRKQIVGAVASTIIAILPGFFILKGIQMTGACILAGIILGLLFSFFCLRRLGGITGDTLGAQSEICETAIIILCATAGRNLLG